VRFENGRFVHTRCITRDVTGHVRVDEALRTLVACTRTTGPSFFQILTQALAEALEVRSALVAEVVPGEPSRAHALAVWTDGAHAEPTEWGLARTPCGQVLREQQTIFHRDGLRRRFPDDGRLAALGAESYLGTPLRASSGAVLGVLAVVHDRPIDEARQPEALLGIFASQAAAEVERTRDDEELRESWEIVETVNRVSRALLGELDLQRLLQAVIDAATEVTGAHYGVFLYNAADAGPDSHALYAVSGVERATFAGLPLPRDTGIFLPTLSGEAIVRLDDATADPRYGTRPPYGPAPANHLPIASYLAVPVVSRAGVPLGGLFLVHPERAVFGERHERLVVGLAAQAAIALDNARLYAGERRAREQAEAANRAKDAFLATVSHELRTPLSPILAWARLLKKGSLDAEKTERALATIERCAQAQAQLVEDLLDVSRIVTGKLRLDVRPVPLAPVIERAVEVVRPAADAKGVRLEAALDTETGAVLGDAERLQQVVWNLLSNAVKFTSKGGRVRVALKRVDSHVEIAVSDTGQGIERGFLPRIFERFQQADTSTTRAHGGLGIGLAIVRHIIEAHGGGVHADSPGIDRGAVFTVRLPVMTDRTVGEQARLQSAASTAAQDQMIELDGLRILVVDDEPDSNEVVRTLLSSCGAEVRVAASAEQAREILGRWSADLLVSDVGMPGEDGYSLVGRLRAENDKRARIPAVALTAYASREDKIRLLSAGFQAHVPKPLDPAELVTVVASIARTAGLL